MYRAKNYRQFSKVLRKYGPKYLRKYGRNTPYFLMYQLLDDEGRFLEKYDGWVGVFARNFYSRFYLKKAATGEVDADGNDIYAVFRGFILTNKEVQYILELNGQLGMLPASAFGFLPQQV